MFCVNCGKKLSDGARFCNNCGKPVQARSAAPQQNGTEAPIRQTPVRPVEQDTAPRKSGGINLLLPVAALAVVIVIAAVVGIVFLRGSGNEKGDTEAVTVAATEAGTVGEEDPQTEAETTTTVATATKNVLPQITAVDIYSDYFGIDIDYLTFVPYGIVFLDTLDDVPEGTIKLDAESGEIYVWFELYDGEVQTVYNKNRVEIDCTGRANLVLYIAAEGGVSLPASESSLCFFKNLYGCTFIEFNNSLYTGDVSDLSYYFENDYSLTDLDLSGWDTSNVTDMNWMFDDCQSLESLNLSGWDISGVTNMSCMFISCTVLESLDLSGWDTSGVTNMSYMFYFCDSLETLDIGGWDTSCVTDITGMFFACKGLETLDLSGWDTSNVHSMYEMFGYCESLETLDLSGWDTSSVTEASRMFKNCYSLESLNLSGCDADSALQLQTWLEETR